MSNNPYYGPEEMGLANVFEIEFSDQCWQYDTRVVWRHESGKYYTARDSGCSCPTPFEDYDSLDKLEELSIDEIRREIRDDLDSSSATSRGEAMDKLRELEIMVRNENR